MRAHERHGITKGDVQRRINETYWSRLTFNERGWPVPYTTADAFKHLGEAAWHRYYRLTILRRHLTTWMREDHMNSWQWAMKRARGCEAPRLP